MRIYRFGIFLIFTSVIISAGMVYTLVLCRTSTGAGVACLITGTGAEGEAVAARDAAGEGATYSSNRAVAVSVWITSGGLVAANVLMLLPLLIRN